jgi:two-component system sensor histidine kinase PilS (NtrC family)
MLGLSLAFQVVKGERVETFYTLIIVTYILTVPSIVLLRRLSSSSALTI